MLLRDPLGYLWTYGFKWQEPDETEEPLQLDALATGNILHATLERAVSELEAAKPGGFGTADDAAVADAIGRALDAITQDWERTRPVPIDAGLDLLHPFAELGLGEVLVPGVHRLELAAINGGDGMGEQVQPPAQRDELPTRRPDRRAIVLSEVRDGLEVRRQPPSQPHHFDVALRLPLQPAA